MILLRKLFKIPKHYNVFFVSIPKHKLEQWMWCFIWFMFDQFNIITHPTRDSLLKFTWLTVQSKIPRSTGTAVVINPILACSTIHTGFFSTFILVYMYIRLLINIFYFFSLNSIGRMILPINIQSGQNYVFKLFLDMDRQINIEILIIFLIFTFKAKTNYLFHRKIQCILGHRYK